MARLLARDLIRQGVSTSRALLSHQDKIWSRYSRDKVDIGETLARVLRTLSKALPLDLPLRALSVGSSTEPQFRILEASFRGGLYLLDIERAALAVINERIRRQAVTHVSTLRDNYTEIFADRDRTRRFLRGALGGRRLHLIALEHSLYYCPADRWRQLLDNVFEVLLAPAGAVHCVMMSASATDPSTTTWLYNHSRASSSDTRTTRTWPPSRARRRAAGGSRGRRSSRSGIACDSSWTTSAPSCRWCG